MTVCCLPSCAWPSAGLGPGAGGALLASRRYATGSDWKPATPAGRTIGGFFQPVEIKAPPGVSISLAATINSAAAGGAAPRRAADRLGLSAPRDEHSSSAGRRDWRSFPRSSHRSALCPAGPGMPLCHSRGDCTARHLNWPWRGKFVTRVIYLEDPHNALPTREAASRRIGSRWRRATIRWRWPTVWAGRWPFSAWADAAGSGRRRGLFLRLAALACPVRRARDAAA